MKKDILYCDNLYSARRNNCLIVLDILLNFLLKWFSPILVFTTEEIYQLLKNKSKKSIHLEDFTNPPEQWNNSNVKLQWSKIKKLKQVVNAAIEEVRNKKIIGSSLEANLNLHVDEEYFDSIKNEDLSEIFICSLVNVEKLSKGDDLFILKDIKGVGAKVLNAKGSKCPRCWKILETNCARKNCGLQN